MKHTYFTLLIVLFCFQEAFAQQEQLVPVADLPVYFDVSPPLREMVKYAPTRADNSWKEGVIKNKFNIKPRPVGDLPGGMNDPNLQNAPGAVTSDTTIRNFPGNTNTEGYYPPDTHGDVSTNYYFQVVNCHYSIYNKTSEALVLGPILSSTIWTGFSNNSNDGDAIVLYDEQADRWIFSQFSLPSGSTNYQMIAVSQTNDPTGSWYRYQYSFSDMPDYPKFGVWPDGYYMTCNRFGITSGSYLGIGAYAYDRTAMLAGSATATRISFTLGSSAEPYSMLPSDCDGAFPSGNPPNYFVYMYDGSSNDHLGIYEFHADFTNTANSTFTSAGNLAVNAFTTNYTAVTQKGSSVKLDALNDRLMYRLQYRTFGSYSTMVCNHTVDITSSLAGIRWYELRKTTGSWSVYQQGTYSPTNAYNRWMASIAMNASGDIAMGYSIAGTNNYPSIRYTGRKNGDALNTMTIAEKGIFNGNGAQTGSYARWGDYSAMNIDPSDNTTFWYTTEYMPSTSTNGWATRIASFKFSNAPIVSTLAASSVTGTTAVLNGTINPNGLSSNYHFEWGTTTSYGNSTLVTSAGSGTSPVTVNASISGLTAGVTYHFRLTGQNSDGTSYGDDLTFAPGAATVTTTAASPITMNGATSGGNVTADGGSSVTARGVCWSTSANPTLADNHTTDGTGTGLFTSSITGLSSNTTYHVRAYATNTAGTFYGEDLQFTTLCAIYTLPFTESFATTSMPNCWSQVDNQGNGQIWVFGTITGESPNPSLTGNYAYLNSDDYGSGNSQNADLLTPTLDLSNYTTVTLQFKHYFRAYSGSSGTLSYSINNGSTWTQITQFTSTTANPATFSQAIAAVSGKPQVKFKWNYTGTWGYYWAVDDIQITGTMSVLTPGTASASQNVCSGGTPASLSATSPTGGVPPYTYLWQNSSDGSVFNDISGATSLTYQPGALTNTTFYRVKQSGSGGSGTVYTNNVVLTVKTLPVPLITGPGTICGIPSANNTYTTEAGMTGYTWTISEGGTIVSGQGTRSIKVTWTAIGDRTLSVTYTDANLCTPETPSIKAVTVYPLPAGAGPITGTAVVRQGWKGVIYSVEPVDGATKYAWTLTDGATIVAGDSTNIITVDFSADALPGTFIVSGVNACGQGAASPLFELTVNPFVPEDRPLADITLSTGNIACYDATRTITVAGEGTTVLIESGAYAHLVAGQNIIFLPDVQVMEGAYLLAKITETDNYCESVETPFVAKKQGSSNQKEAAGPTDEAFRIFPNPTTGKFTVEIPEKITGAHTTLRIYDLMGGVVFSEEAYGPVKMECSLADKPAGIYILKIVQETFTGTAKIIKKQ